MQPFNFAIRVRLTCVKRQWIIKEKRIAQKQGFNRALQIESTHVAGNSASGLVAGSSLSSSLLAWLPSFLPCSLPHSPNHDDPGNATTDETNGTLAGGCGRSGWRLRRRRVTLSLQNASTPERASQRGRREIGGVRSPPRPLTSRSPTRRYVHEHRHGQRANARSRGSLPLPTTLA